MLCSHEVTIWAAVEARLSLHRYLARHCRDEFSKSSERNEEFLSLIQTCLATVVKPCIPFDPVPDSLVNRLQGNLVGVLFEAEYARFGHSIRLFHRLLEYYEEGRFPCGWICDSPAAFPDNMTILLY